MRRSFIRYLVPLAAVVLSAPAAPMTTTTAVRPRPRATTAGAVTRRHPGDTARRRRPPPADDATPTPADEVQTGESVLDTVIANDVVRCGVRDDLPGFNSVDAAGEQVGFDADFCRVIAAAVLGDATKVEFVHVETDDRFTALQSGEFDVLVRNTTWTAGRDGAEGATFLHPTYYDGQSMMVAADSRLRQHRRHGRRGRLRGRGTTSEGNVAAEFDPPRPDHRVQSFDDRRPAPGGVRSPAAATAGRATSASSRGSARPTRTGRPEA